MSVLCWQTPRSQPFPSPPLSLQAHFINTHSFIVSPLSPPYRLHHRASFPIIITMTMSTRCSSSCLFLFLSHLLSLLHLSHAQFQSRSPTRSPTPVPTTAPLTLNCNMTGYKQAFPGTNESCYNCRTDFACAWCMPASPSTPPYCFDNVVDVCLGQGASYGTSVCVAPLGAAAVAVIAGVFVMIFLCCCCCAGGLYFMRRKQNRNLLVMGQQGGVQLQPQTQQQGYVGGVGGGIGGPILGSAPPPNASANFYYTQQPQPRPPAQSQGGYYGGQPHTQQFQHQQYPHPQRQQQYGYPGAQQSGDGSQNYTLPPATVPGYDEPAKGRYV